MTTLVKAGSMDGPEDLWQRSMVWMGIHVQAHEARRKSKAEQRYSQAIRRSTEVLVELMRRGDFDTLLEMEATLQRFDLDKYSSHPTVRKNVAEGIEDLEKGMTDYHTLMTSPEQYAIKAYVKRDLTGRDKSIPLDAMRKALRSQATRVKNYARNPMANDDERAFFNARVSLIRKAEKLYDRIQRETRDGEA